MKCIAPVTIYSHLCARDYYFAVDMAANALASWIKNSGSAKQYSEAIIGGWLSGSPAAIRMAREVREEALAGMPITP